MALASPGVEFNVAELVVTLQMNCEVVVEPAGALAHIAETSQSPAGSDSPVKSFGDPELRPTLAVPVCVPDCDPVVVIAVPARAFAMEVAISNVFVVIVDGMT
jgi:hypothetical protein